MNIPAYDNAMAEFVDSVIHGLVATDSILGQIPVRSTGHAGPTRNVPGPSPVDHPLTTFRETYSFHADVIRETDVMAFLDALIELAEKYEEAMGKTLFRTLSDVTEAVGNVIEAKGKPLSLDHFLDAIEMTEFSFDEDGNAHQQIFVNPETFKLLRTLKPTPEQQQRHDDILRRKKERWDAEKRDRRLPRPRQGATA